MSKLIDSLSGVLEPGEEVRTTRAVAPAGDLGARLPGGAAVAGIAGALTADAGGQPVVVPPKTDLLVVTTARVLLCRTRFGKVAEITATLPLRDVATIDAVKARLAFGKLTVGLRDGRSVLFDLKSDRGLDEFLSEARGALGAQA